MRHDCHVAPCPGTLTLRNAPARHPDAAAARPTHPHPSLAMTALRLLVAAASVAVAAPLAAQPLVQSTGAGSAVTRVDASASFESEAALYGNPYVENGLRVTRTGLSLNNNGCGYGGPTSFCAGHPGFEGFAGNYMYGTGSGYFSILAPQGSAFAALEFLVGTGYGQSTTRVAFEAFLSGVRVGSGSATGTVGEVYGFARGGAGFDELRYSDTFTSFAAPALDEVRAQFTAPTSTVPEPGTYALLGAGLVGVAGMTRRRRATTA